MTKRILILGAGKEQLPAIQTAKKKNIRTVVIDINPNAEGARHADEFFCVSTRDRDAILQFIEEYKNKIDGVMTIASDIPHMVATAAEALGVPHIPLAVADACVHKFRMKEVLSESGVNIPAFADIRSASELQQFISARGYPVVIKPVDNSGARGVLRLTQEISTADAFQYARGFSYSDRVMAEKFMAGLQISTEGLMVEGKFYCTAFADRNYARVEETVPYMIEDGGDIPTILLEDKKALVVAEFEKAVRALGINWGPAKGDMVLGNDGKPYVIEIAARLSGGNLCYDKVPWSTGVDIVDILIDMSVGNPVDVAKLKPTRDLATSQRYFFPHEGTIKRINGLTKAARIKYVRKVDVWVGVGDVVSAIENHPSRVGYVISCAPTRTEAEAAARDAVAAVEFEVIP